MLDHKLAKFRVSSTGRISVIAVAAFLYIVWHRPAFSVEPVVAVGPAGAAPAGSGDPRRAATRRQQPVGLGLDQRRR